MGTSHDEVARRIARKEKTSYNRGKGADVKGARRAVEVETEKTVADATRQLQGHRKPSYIAGTNKKAVDIALKVTRGTTIGVMDRNGNVIKRSTRKKK